MMTRCKIHQVLNGFIEDVVTNFPDIKFYIFGSYLNSESWNDVDVLIVYKDTSEILKIENRICEVLTTGPFHFTLLTISEEQQLDFVSIHGAREYKI